MDDAKLISEAEKAFSVERLLVAAKLLEKVQDKSLLRDEHRSILKWAEITETSMRTLLQSPEEDGSPWIKQCEKHGHRDFFVYYQVDEQHHLTSRIDCAIESSLLLPILSVFNESDLYGTWMPSWKRPFKLGIQESCKLKETGRGNQIIKVSVAMPFPVKTRETVQHAVAVDVIEEEGAIAIQVLSETTEDDPIIPEPSRGVVRIDFECSILIRACPPDHPCLAKSKHEYPEGEELILMSLKMKVDSKVSYIPLGLINFVTRTVLGTMWSALLSVAEEVRDGKRPLHQEMIDEKQELYDWVNARVGVMIEKMKSSDQVDKSNGQMSNGH